jgi:hypothetical protein
MSDPINDAIAKGLAAAYQLGFHEALGVAAGAAYAEAERIKHTSHADGLGMGSLCCEAACMAAGDAILKLAVKP